MSLEQARALDAADPLRAMRDRFVLPEGVIYLDGNSLGALPKATAAHLAEVVEQQWGADLITSWNKHGWIDWPTQIAAKLAPIVGAKPSELLIADSTTVCLFKLLTAAATARSRRSTLLTEQTNFPTDIYAAEGLLALQPHLRLKSVPTEQLAANLDEDVCALFLTHVDYCGGGRHDMAALNVAAHAAGALTVWDLSHSAGAVALDLNGSGCDLAIGCGYKYLNGGPGAPAFVYVAEALQDELRSPLEGWMGHSNPFAFAPTFEPARGIRRFLTGTPSILSLAALDAGLDTFEGVAIADIAAKSEQLTQFFVDGVEALCGDELSSSSPRDPAARGSHVIFPHEQGYAIMQALIASGVIGDFRPPDVMRFGFAPLYNSFEDAWLAASTMGEVLRTGEWNQANFLERKKVT